MLTFDLPSFFVDLVSQLQHPAGVENHFQFSAAALRSQAAQTRPFIIFASQQHLETQWPQNNRQHSGADGTKNITLHQQIWIRRDNYEPWQII